MATKPKLKSVTVTTAATAVRVIATATAVAGNVVGVIIQAHTGTVYVGDSTVSSTNGIKLVAATNDKLTLPINAQDSIDIKEIYICSAADNDVANVLYLERT
jgi:hypothetical protein